MKAKLLLLCAFEVFMTLSAISQNNNEECKKCGTREVYCYDIAVLAKNPYAMEISQECLNDPDCIGRIQKWEAFWQSLHFVSAGYKQSLLPKGEMPENCVIFTMASKADQEPWIRPDLYIATQKAYPALLRPVRSGDGSVDATPAFSSLPPRGDWTDYVIYGTLNGGTGGNMNMELKVWNFRRSEEVRIDNSSFNVDDNENYRGITNEGNKLTGGSPQRITDAIHSYEKQKRDKSNLSQKGLIAIEPDLKFSQESYVFQQESSKLVKLQLNLKDCDETPLVNREVELKTSSGQLLPNKVLTDKQGNTTVSLIATEDVASIIVSAEWKFEYPSARKNMVTTQAKISFIKPVEYLYATIKVNAIAKKSWKSNEKVDRIEENKFEYETKMVLFICRDCVETLTASPDRNNVRFKDYNVVSGGSFYQKWDYEKSLDPVAEFRVPVLVKKDLRTEGFRSSGDSDWGPLYIENVSHQVTTQAVLIYISPLIDNKVTAAGAKPTPQYVFKMRAPTIITEFGKNSQTNNGKVERWDESYNKMVDIPPPFDCMVPFVEDPFFVGDDEQSKVSPPVIDAKELEPYLLNPVGEKILNLHGTAFRPDNGSDYEVTMDINIVLSPKND